MENRSKATYPTYDANGKCRFRVWAPEKQRMVLHIVHPFEKYADMEKDEEGYFFTEFPDLPHGTLYYYRPDDEKDIPDPASLYQPQGVHGPSAVVDHQRFSWKDKDWNGLPLPECILYEIHVGTFTPEGTFDAIIPRLNELAETGINAIELMPVSQFPGNRNWGYDGVYPYAVQNSYGGTEGLKRLTDACHQKGIAVILDVVYNHMGPEGNYLGMFGPYFTDQYKTPWGMAINLDGPWSDGVREYLSENVLYWFEQFHVDGLRVDAIHTMYDNGAVHFWEMTYYKIKRLEERLGRKFFTIAESDYNSPKVVRLPENGGYGFTAQWLDDFHHALYVKIDEKGSDRYYDFGRMDQLAKAYRDGFVHSGEFVKFRKRKHGASSTGIPGDRFIAFNMNHDQVGNRVKGERLCMLVDNERLKIAAAALLLSPYVPMLFMGEEYADDSPFYYFVSHSDEELIRAVQEGRKNEFRDFGFDESPPDPQDVQTFQDSKIKWDNRSVSGHKVILDWHKSLIQLRKSKPALQNFDKKYLQFIIINENAFGLWRQTPDGQHNLLALFNLSEKNCSYTNDHIKDGHKILDSTDVKWKTGDTQYREPYPVLIHAGMKIMVQSLSVVVYEIPVS